MATFSSCSAVRETVDNFSFSLKARHILDVGTPLQVVDTRRSVPEDVDVTLGSSDMVFTLSGVLNGKKIAPLVMQLSAISHHTICYLKANSDQLGLSAVSDIYLDEDGHAKFSVTSSRSLRPRVGPLDVRLIAIHLVYACKSTAQPTDCDAVAEGANPFAIHVYLPLVSALDRVLEKFASLHLVKRYPLIFGPWRAKLDCESPVFIHIFRSIARIAERSTNASFRKKFRRLRRKIETQHLLAVSSSLGTLQSLLGIPEGQNLATTEDSNFTADKDRIDVLCQSMERLFRQGIRPARFKGVQITHVVDDTSADAQHALDLSHDYDVDMDGSMEDLFHDDMREDNIIGTEDLDDDLYELELSDDASAVDEDWFWEIPPTQEANWTLLHGCGDVQPLKRSCDVYAHSTGEHQFVSGQVSKAVNGDLPVPLRFDDDELELCLDHERSWTSSSSRSHGIPKIPNFGRDLDRLISHQQEQSPSALFHGLDACTATALGLPETQEDCLDYSKSPQSTFHYGGGIDSLGVLDMDLQLYDGDYVEDCPSESSISSKLTTPESSQISRQIDADPRGSDEVAFPYFRPPFPAVVAGPDCRRGDAREMVLEFDEDGGDTLTMDQCSLLL